MAALTLATMASRALRNAQIPEDGSTAAVQALADAKSWINERARDVWKRRHWREYVILGSFTVPANTQRIALTDIVPDTGFNTSANGYNATFFEISAIRSGTVGFQPEDAGAINNVQPDLWANGTTPALFPIKFVNRGQSGVFLLGTYSTPTLLNFFGKANFQDLADSDTWVLNNENCLIAGGTADILRANDRDDARSGTWYQEYESEIAKLIDQAEVQGANIKRIIPLDPWTDLQNRNQLDTSLTGCQPLY